MKFFKKVCIAIAVTLVMGCLLSGCAVTEKIDEGKEEAESRVLDLRFSAEEQETFEKAAKAGGKTGMIIAIGGGFDTEETFLPLIEKAIAHLRAKTPKVVYVPTASGDKLDKDEKGNVAEERYLWFLNAGCQCDTLFVTQEDAEAVATKLADADIIYAPGGSLKKLTEAWAEKGVYAEMKKAYDRGAVLMGVSSGAMCWADKGWDDCGEEVFRITDSFPFLGNDASYDFYDCAGILPFCICPHFDNVAWRVYEFEAWKQDFPSVCIENGAAVVECGGEYEVLSDKATPNRTAYLIHINRKIVRSDLKKNAELLTYVAGEAKK